MAIRTIRAIIMNSPNASPIPSELASQARPRPAAKPPSMAPHGRFGAAAAGGVAGLAAAALCVGAAAGALGAASRLVTLLDCWPTDLPPPIRLAASALMLPSVSTKESAKVKSLMSSPIQSINSIQKELLTLDSNMQCHHPACQVMNVHMVKTPIFHKGFEFFLARMHTN